MNLTGNLYFLAANLLHIFSLLILIDVVISWAQVMGARGVSGYHPLVRTLRRVTGPALDPVRRWIPPHKTSGWDLSPIVVLVVIQLLQQFLVRAGSGY